MQRLNTLMKSLMLRRTKIQLQENGELKALPSKQIKIVEINLHKDEMNVYQKILIYSQTLFAQFLIQRENKNDYGVNPLERQLDRAKIEHYQKMYKKLFPQVHGKNSDVKSHDILVLLLRLRQICCHPGLINSVSNQQIINA